MQTRFATSVLAAARAAFGEDIETLARSAEAALAAPLPAGALEARQTVFLGSGWSIGLAHEAALKLREAAQAWSESYPAMEYRHGPIALAAARHAGLGLRRCPGGPGRAGATPRARPSSTMRSTRSSTWCVCIGSRSSGRPCRVSMPTGPVTSPVPSSSTPPCRDRSPRGTSHGIKPSSCHHRGDRARRRPGSSRPAAAAASRRRRGGVVHITISHGYTDVEAKAITAQVATWNASHPKIQVKLLFNGGNDGALQKTLANLAVGSPPDIAYEYGSSMAALAGRPKVVDLTDKVKRPELQLERLLLVRAGRGHERRQGLRRAGPGRQPRARLQQEAVRRGGCRVPDRQLDVGRLPIGGEEADRRRQQAVRMGVRGRRFRGHDLALARDAVASGRRSPLARRHEVCVRLSRRA